MTDAPRIPEEQLSFVADADADRPGLLVGTRSGQTDDADFDPGTVRRFGDLKQGLTNQWTVRER